MGQSTVVRSVLALSLVISGNLGPTSAYAGRRSIQDSSDSSAFLPRPLEKALLQGSTAKVIIEKLAPYLTKDDIKAAIDVLGTEAYTKLPIGKRSGKGYVFQIEKKQVRLSFEFKEARGFKINDEFFEIREDEKLPEAMKRLRAQAAKMTAAADFRHPLHILMIPDAQANAALLALVGAVGSAVYYAHSTYTAMQTQCDTLNTAARGCNIPLRKMADQIQACRRESLPEKQRELARAQARVRREETRNPINPIAVAQARLDVENLRNGLPDLSDEGSSAKCTPNSEQQESDAYTGAVDEAEKTYHDMVAMLENRDSAQAMRFKCDQHRTALRNCRDRIKKAADILGLDITRERVSTAEPASPRGGRQ